jgi:hypothetical protein
MPPHHPRTRIAHDSLDFFTLVSLVAMDRTSGAGWFVVAKAAMVQAQSNVADQIQAIRA